MIYHFVREYLCVKSFLQNLKVRYQSLYSECAKLVKVGKYPFPLIGNMNETPVFFDMVPERSLVSTGKKFVSIRTSGSEKRDVTIVLTVAADRFILSPMIIFRGKTNLTIKDMVAPESFVIVTPKKAWMDEY